MSNEVQTAMQNARAHAAQLHLIGLLIEAMIQGGVLSQIQANLLIADAKSKLHADDPVQLIFGALLREYPIQPPG